MRPTHAHAVTHGTCNPAQTLCLVPPARPPAHLGSLLDAQAAHLLHEQEDFVPARLDVLVDVLATQALEVLHSNSGRDAIRALGLTNGIGELQSTMAGASYQGARV